MLLCKGLTPSSGAVIAARTTDLLTCGVYFVTLPFAFTDDGRFLHDFVFDARRVLYHCRFSSTPPVTSNAVRSCSRMSLTSSRNVSRQTRIPLPFCDRFGFLHFVRYCIDALGRSEWTMTAGFEAESKTTDLYM